uniref:Secreted protein n=1 Tax=Cacopsylla melanoneura TaxID=428564 RepID=A0A8D8WSF9_9HEMI
MFCLYCPFHFLFSSLCRPDLVAHSRVCSVWRTSCKTLTLNYPHGLQLALVMCSQALTSCSPVSSFCWFSTIIIMCAPRIGKWCRFSRSSLFWRDKTNSFYWIDSVRTLNNNKTNRKQPWHDLSTN